MRRFWFWALITAAFLAACGKPPSTVEGFSAVAGPIAKRPAKYAGQTVTLTGYYRGQDLLDEVTPGFPPTDRFQDWVIKDNTGALYVAASKLLPFASSSQEVWRIVSVTGVITTHNVGTSGVQAYVIPQKIVWQDPKFNFDILPAHCLIAVHRFEGPEKLDHHIFIYDDRRMVVYDAKNKVQATAKYGEVDMGQVQKTFRNIQFFSLPDAVGEPCQACIRYHIAAVDTQKQLPHYVLLYEGSVPPKLQAVIDQIIEKANKAKKLE